MGGVHRRRFVFAASAVLAGATLPSPPAPAQKPGRVYRIAVFFSSGSATMQPHRDALRERLAKDGYVEGSNLQTTWRAAMTGRDENRRVASELVALQPDAMLTFSSAMTQAAQFATKSIPIVFVHVSDPIAEGVVADYARPGGNTTGVSTHHRALLAKRFELVRELLPNAKRVALIVPYATDVSFIASQPVIAEAVKRLKFHLIEVNRVSLWMVQKERAEAMIVYSVLGERLSAEYLVEQALKLRIPAIFPDAESVAAGALASYGTDPLEDTRLGADLMARVLNGANPGDVPVYQNSNFTLTINLKTARAIGLTIPQHVRLRAETLIQ